MFRQHWGELETHMQSLLSDLKSDFYRKMKPSRNKVEKFILDNPAAMKRKKEEFLAWGRVYVEELKQKSETEKVIKAKEDFFVLLRSFGINDELLRQTFNENKKEILDPVIGEAVALISIVLGWKEKDKESFSQALGEIGVAGVFAAKPFICLIAICGLAWGYQENFHGESFKKGGFLGVAGFLAAAVSPGGFVGFLSAIITMLYFNKKLKIDRPIESQLKEILGEIKKGGLVKELKTAWKGFEDFLSKLLIKNKEKPS